MLSNEKVNFKIANAFHGIEVVDANYTKQTFSKHVHEGYTIGIIEYGVQRFYRSGETHIAPKNSIILVNADDVHTGESATQNGWGYKALYPTPEYFNQISSDLNRGNNIAPYFQSSVIEDPQLANQLRLFFSQVANNSSRLMVETLLYATMVSLTSRHANMNRCPKDLSGNKKNLLLVKEFLDIYAEKEIPLNQLAVIAGLSQYHFIRQFKKLFGLAPHSYQIQARLKKATTLLKLGVKSIQVAIDCGFHDQSHFTHHFKKALGITPSLYQKQAIIYKNS